MSNAQPPQVVGLLLAAGSGSRFDLDAPGRKLRERVDGKMLVERAFDALAGAVDVVVVVTRDEFTEVCDFAAARAASVVIAEDAALGMGHSLAAGVRRIQLKYPQVTTVIVALADMPWVLPDTVALLAATSVERDCITQPTYRSQRGNPVAFPARFLDRLAASRGDAGARELLREQGAAVLRVDVEDLGVVRDVDVRADLAGGTAAVDLD